ncbi:hypothetical protein [Thermovenabulum sp.]|uniref:hypothetical protein n=1 Tax=Thermovenabulum sp. TaxID=3100335 RepID=UPI003C7C421F
MGERLKFDDYINKLKKDSFKVYSLFESKRSGYKAKKRRLRDPEESFILFLLDYKRWEKALKTGAIVEIGPRRFRLDWTKDL